MSLEESNKIRVVSTIKCGNQTEFLSERAEETQFGVQADTLLIGYLTIVMARQNNAICGFQPIFVIC